METVSLPDDLDALEHWIEANREGSLTNVREDQRWKEWYCFAAFYRCRHANWFLPTKSTVTWFDADGAPDFEVTSKSGTFFVEVTEATDPKERQAIAMARHLPLMTPRLVGKSFQVDGKQAPEGRFPNGSGAEGPERAMVDDIKAAISRKAKKSYASESGLLIYPNNDLVPLRPQLVVDFLKGANLLHPFRWVVVLWPDEQFVEVGQGTVVLHYKP